MIMQTEVVPGSKSYKYDPPTAERISSNPLDRDQYEVKHVTVKKSNLEGDGIFALKSLRKNTLACFFSGFKVKENYVEGLWVEKVGGKENFLNLKREDPLCQEFIERKSYLIALDEENDLDLPPDIAVDNQRFRATSG